MAHNTNGATTPPHATVNMEVPLKWSAPPPAEYKPSSGAGGVNTIGMVHATLRALLFGTSLAGMLVMVTADQTKPVPISPTMTISVDVKYSVSPSYIYYIAALSVATLYSIITGGLLFFSLKKTGGVSSKLQYYFGMLDTLLLGIVSSAAGATTAVAWIGLKGNTISRWHKICYLYNTFCLHLETCIGLSLTCSMVLIALVWLSFYVQSKKLGSR